MAERVCSCSISCCAPAAGSKHLKAVSFGLTPTAVRRKHLSRLGLSSSTVQPLSGYKAYATSGQLDWSCTTSLTPQLFDLHSRPQADPESHQVPLHPGLDSKVDGSGQTLLELYCRCSVHVGRAGTR